MAEAKLARIKAKLALEASQTGPQSEHQPPQRQPSFAGDGSSSSSHHHPAGFTPAISGGLVVPVSSESVAHLDKQLFALSKQTVPHHMAGRPVRTTAKKDYSADPHQEALDRVAEHRGSLQRMAEAMKKLTVHTAKPEAEIKAYLGQMRALTGRADAATQNAYLASVLAMDQPEMQSFLKTHAEFQTRIDAARAALQAAVNKREAGIKQ